MTLLWDNSPKAERKGEEYWHYVIAAMCWPNAEEKRVRIASLFAQYMLDQRTNDILGEFVALSDSADASREMADLVILKVTSDNYPPKVWWAIIEDIVPSVLGKSTDVFQDFMRICRHPKIRAIFRNEFEDKIKGLSDRHLTPHGGLQAVVDAPSHDDLMAEIKRCCEGPQMCAGLVLATITRMTAYHAEAYPPSLRRTYHLLDKLDEVPLGATKLEESWKNYRDVAPLWAGVIAVNHYKPLDFNTTIEILQSPTCRDLALVFAQSFSQLGSFSLFPERKEPLIPVSDLLQFQSPIPFFLPTLPPLSSRELAVARTYRAPNKVDQLRARKSRL